MFDTMQVAKTIREARIRKNLTQTALADEMGVSYQAVSNWERGNSMPDITKLEDLCNILSLTLNELLGAGGTADVVQKVMRQEQVTPEELAEVAPVVPPKEYKRVAEHSAKPVSIGAIISMAPFLDQEYLDTLVADAQVEDVSQLVCLAPFLSQMSLDRLAEKAKAEDMSELVSLATFLGQQTLDRLVQQLLDRGEVENAAGLYPFLSQKTMRRLAKMLLDKGDVEQLQNAAPFL